MAKTFYKYGERDAISYVDWSQVGRNFTDMVDTEVARRESQRAEIQKGVDETMKFINDNPIGDFDVANDFSLSHAKNAQEYLLMTDKLLKAGKIRPQDFVRMRENLKTGTEGIYEVANAYQKRYQEVMDDINSGDPQLSNLVYSQMTSLEGIGKLKNTDAIIDTSSGRVNLSKYDVADDGVKNYTEAYTTNELKAFLQSDIKRFDVKGVAKEAADSLGGLTESYVAEAQRAGGIHILRESVNRYDSSELKGVKEGYQKWLDDTVDSYMSDVQQASILADFLQGQGYEAVTDRRKFDEDKTGKLLYIKPNGQIEFQDGQKELARETLKNQIHYSIEQKYSEKTAGYKQYAPTTTPPKGKGLDADEVVNMLGYLYYGDETMMDTATTYFRDAIPNVQKVDRQKDTLIVTFADGSSRDFKITGLTQQEFIEGATPLFAGEVDLTGAIGRARFDPNQVKTDFTSSALVTLPQTDEELAREYVRVSPIDANLGSRELSNKLNSLFNVLGFKVEKSFGKVSITSPSGVSVKFQTDDVQGIKEFIQGNITKPNAESASEFMKEYIEGIPTAEPTQPTQEVDAFGNPI
jgi:hypothetical protein